MKEDPIMQELRRVRRKLLKEAGGDLGKLLENSNRRAKIIMTSYRRKLNQRSAKTAQ
jgi:hypothetical protein